MSELNIKDIVAFQPEDSLNTPDPLLEDFLITYPDNASRHKAALEIAYSHTSFEADFDEDTATKNMHEFLAVHWGEEPLVLASLSKLVRGYYKILEANKELVPIVIMSHGKLEDVLSDKEEPLSEDIELIVGNVQSSEITHGRSLSCVRGSIGIQRPQILSYSLMPEFVDRFFTITVPMDDEVTQESVIARPSCGISPYVLYHSHITLPEEPSTYKADITAHTTVIGRDSCVAYLGNLGRKVGETFEEPLDLITAKSA